MNNKVHLRGPFQRLEIPAAGTILPGMLIEQASTGVQAHSTAGGFAELLVADEDALQGGTILGFPNNFGLNSSTSYTGYTVAGLGGVGPDMVQICAEQSGNLLNMLFKAGSNYTIGTKLISAGDGTLKPTTGTPSQIIAVVTAALNLSASGAVNTIGQCRFL